MFSFTVLREDKNSCARTGIISTPHGVIHTPAFVPVGTQATVKSMTPDDLLAVGVELFFVNTYHVYLKPGTSVIKKFGGLHEFMNWRYPLITDSGGFQIFSLGSKRFVKTAITQVAIPDRKKFVLKDVQNVSNQKMINRDEYKPIGQLVAIDNEGVTFTSHWDGSRHRFTPNDSIDIQHLCGADILMAFDECPPYPASHAYAKDALERTHNWARLSLLRHQAEKKSSQALYGVVQGSVYEDLRRQSAEFIGELPFAGVAIGGVAVGESKEEMRRVCDWVVPLLPSHKPRHLLGVGEIDDIFDIVERGIDTFDCVMPTRLARMGHVLVNATANNARVKNWTIDLSKKSYAEDKSPIDPTCGCYACANFSRAYLHHLFRVRELLSYRLATIHNLYFVISITKDIRQAIEEGSFLELKRKWLL